jgi:Uma2 family endonuclease
MILMASEDVRMSTLTLPEKPPVTAAAVPHDFILRLSVKQYHQMIESGILTDDDQVELLEGWLVYKMAKTPPHRLATGLVREALAAVVPAGWYVDSQEPITLADSEPEPDGVIVRGARRDYLRRHPGPEDVALVVEVANATLERDRGVKKKLYAQAAIPAYWIINLAERQCEVYTQPSGPTDEPDYRVRQNYKPGEEVPVVVAGREVGRLSVGEILP